ncbi:DNA-processing protein DprA [Shewanella algae]
MTISEWARFAYWLREQNISPENLLMGDLNQNLKGWHDPMITQGRINELLNRGNSLALAVEKWTRAGLWILTRSDPGYPKRLKNRLKTNSPPVLYGCGNIDLLNNGGIAVVGSRDASEADLKVAEHFGHRAADEGISIVSGGSRGVDEAAMLGAVNANGTTIGVLSEDLYRVSTSKLWRQSLLAGKTALISPFYPEAGFSAANAMGRNKYIYCLADASLVVHSGKKGGTINGAEENLKNNWVPLWVSHTADKYAANADLVAKGGRWLVESVQTLSVAELVRNEGSQAVFKNDVQADLFSMPVHQDFQTVSDLKPEPQSKSEEIVFNKDIQLEEIEVTIEQLIPCHATTQLTIDFYQLFTNELQILAREPITFDDLIRRTQLHKSQLSEWLKRAEEEGLVTKLNRPIRYQVVRSL